LIWHFQLFDLSRDSHFFLSELSSLFLVKAAISYKGGIGFRTFVILCWVYPVSFGSPDV